MVTQSETDPVDYHTTKISIISCTHRPDYYYQNVVASLNAVLSQVELIEIDNRGQRFTLPAALNQGIDKASGDILVLCHHDVVFPPFWLDQFRKNISAVEKTDPNWGVIGLVGVSLGGAFIGHVHDPSIKRRLGSLPAEAQSLDEVCLVLRANSDLRFDTQLKGMHFYGADICLQARMRGMKCYAIDAPLRHLSSGTRDSAFYMLAKDLQHKWSKVTGAPSVIETTCGIFALQQSWTAKLVLWKKKLFRAVRGKFDLW